MYPLLWCFSNHYFSSPPPRPRQNARLAKAADKAGRGLLAFREIQVVFSDYNATFRQCAAALEANDRVPSGQGGMKKGFVRVQLRHVASGARAEFTALRPLSCFLWERCELEGFDMDLATKGKKVGPDGAGPNNDYEKELTERIQNMEVGKMKERGDRF